jgi:hypothetical protein
LTSARNRTGLTTPRTARPRSHERLKQFAELIQRPKDYVIEDLRPVFRKTTTSPRVESKPNGNVD